MKITASELVMRLLEKNGVKYVFGVPGGHLLKFYDSLYDHPTITPVLTKHESGAAYIATGYAQVSESLGVCVGTVGPGATNLMTGVASAYMDSIPLLVITANVGSSTIGKGGLQEATGEGRTIEHVELFNGVTKYSTLVFTPKKIREAFRNAISQTLNGRPGPAHIDVTADSFSSEVEFDESQIEKIERLSMGGDLNLIKKAATFIASSRKPAILVGYGGISASGEIKELAEKFKIPVATTLRGKGTFPEDNELSLGCVGLYGTNIANKYLRDGVDVLLAVGTSFSEFTSHSFDPAFQPVTALIHVDVDPWEIGKNYHATVGILGDSNVVLNQINAELVRLNVKPKTDLGTLMNEKSKRQYFSNPKMSSDEVPIKPQRLMKLLRDALPDDVIVFSDVGNNLAWVEGFFQIKKPKSYYICSSLAAMGYGVAASIGGQIAAPDRQVICICGDGDFQMQGMEVVTAVNYHVPVKWFILNNSQLGMIKDSQDILFKGRRISTDFQNPDFVKLAEAMGAVGLRITKPKEVVDVVMEALANEKPTVVDVVIDPNEAPSFDARAEAMVRAWGASPSLWKKIKFIPELLKRR